MPVNFWDMVRFVLSNITKFLYELFVVYSVTGWEKKSVKKKEPVIKKLKSSVLWRCLKKYFEQKVHFNRIANLQKLEPYREKIKTVKLVRLSWQNGGQGPIIKTQELPSSSNSSSQSSDTEWYVLFSDIIQKCKTWICLYLLLYAYWANCINKDSI